MRSKNTIDYCWKIGRILFDGWNKISSNYNLNAMMKGYPIRMKLECFDSQKNTSNDLKALIIQEMVKRGIFMSPGVTFLSFSHTHEDIQFTLQCFDEICKDISEKITNDNYSNYLLGKPPQTIWSMKILPTKKPAN